MDIQPQADNLAPFKCGKIEHKNIGSVVERTN
jgi:hypothetical protein